MKGLLKTTLHNTVRTLRRWKARRTVAQLTAYESAGLKAIADALFETLNNVTTDEEQALMSAVEQRRLSLLRSNDTISMIDFGAGSPGANRTDEEMKKGIRSTEKVSDITRASKEPFWTMLLFKLIRKFEPASCIELGSCVGISASYQAAALHLNGKGRLWTLEGSPEIADLAKETLAIVDLEDASVIEGPFHETFQTALEAAKPLDFLFNDGHHDGSAVLKYFYQTLPYLSEEALIVFDDISWSPSMRKAWVEIEGHERVMISVNLRAMGIAFLSQEEATKRSFRIPL